MYIYNVNVHVQYKRYMYIVHVHVHACTCVLYRCVCISYPALFSCVRLRWVVTRVIPPPPPPPAPRLCRMDSFVLAETFKYLYLLFAEEEELLLDMDGFIFNTEAHLLPLSLASGSGADWREVGEGRVVRGGGVGRVVRVVRG